MAEIPGNRFEYLDGAGVFELRGGGIVPETNIRYLDDDHLVLDTSNPELIERSHNLLTDRGNGNIHLTRSGDTNEFYSENNPWGEGVLMRIEADGRAVIANTGFGLKFAADGFISVSREIEETRRRLIEHLSAGEESEFEQLKYLTGVSVDTIFEQDCFTISEVIDKDTIVVEPVSKDLIGKFGDQSIWLKRQKNGEYSSSDESGYVLHLSFDKKKLGGYVTVSL